MSPRFARPRRATLSLAILALAATAACGSTVNLTTTPGATQNQALGGLNSLGQAVAPTTAPTGSSTPDQGNLSGGPTAPGTDLSTSGPIGGSTGSATAPVPGGGSTPAATATGFSAIAATGKGWDKGAIYIGVITEADFGAAAAGLGLKGVNPGNTKAQANEIAASLNAKGGIFGRQVKIVIDDFKTIATAENPGPAEDSACTYFTQDHPVVAVMNIETTIDYQELRSCLGKVNVPLFSGSFNAVDDQVATTYPNMFFTTTQISWTILAPLLVSRLKAEGWFGGWNPTLGAAGKNPVKVGIIVDSTPTGSQIASLITKALANAGYPGAVSVAYTDATNFQPQVLNFKGKGVTHIIGDDLQLYSFQNSANNQKYNPRYAVTSINSPFANMDAHSPAGQNVGAMGIGWAPTIDVPAAYDPGHPSAGRTACDVLLAKSGQASGERLASTFGYSLCDSIELSMEGAVVGGGLSAAQIFAGMQKIGPSFSSAESFATGISASHYFIPGSVRDLAWSSHCSCFIYTSTTNYPV